MFVCSKAIKCKHEVITNGCGGVDWLCPSTWVVSMFVTDPLMCVCSRSSWIVSLCGFIFFFTSANRRDASLFEN